LKTALLRTYHMCFDGPTTDCDSDSLMYPVWKIFREKVYVCPSTITRRSFGLNVSPANYGSWMGAFGGGRQFDCIYVVPLPSKTSHWHEQVKYQLAQLYVKLTLLPLEMTTSSTNFYCIASTLVPSHREPTASQPPVTQTYFS
jgi:hypothetical protein